VQREPVDAVVLELDRNRAEIALIARQIKQFRPKVPTIVLTEAAAPFDGANDLADALVPKENHPETGEIAGTVARAACSLRRVASQCRGRFGGRSIYRGSRQTINCARSRTLPSLSRGVKEKTLNLQKPKEKGFARQFDFSRPDRWFIVAS